MYEDEGGATSVEYAIIGAFVLVVLLIAVFILSGRVEMMFSAISRIPL